MTEFDQAALDMVLHGTGIMQNGRRIDPVEFFARPEEAPIPPFSKCPGCGGVSMILRPGRPVVCAHCGKERT